MTKKNEDVNIKQNFVQVSMDVKNDRIKIETEHDVIPLEVAEEICTQVYKMTVDNMLASHAGKLTEKLLDNTREVKVLRLLVLVLLGMIIIACLKIKGII